MLSANSCEKKSKAKTLNYSESICVTYRIKKSSATELLRK